MLFHISYGPTNSLLAAGRGPPHRNELWLQLWLPGSRAAWHMAGQAKERSGCRSAPSRTE
eukprot:9158711-Alexandrium_andersonii.AAC.1